MKPDQNLEQQPLLTMPSKMSSAIKVASNHQKFPSLHINDDAN
jgi:hypothetical protein